MTRKIMVIRHAEKPDPAHGVLGVDETGREDAEDLSVAGWQRAGALARFFVPIDQRPADAVIETPASIFASKAIDASKSLRPQHTVAPTAALLNGTDTRFSEGHEDELVKAVLDGAGAVLISWHHEAIPKIVTLLGYATAPQKWDKTRFDVV
ncbi:histidine phosphatase family protein [Rhizobium calliandrae]|uniref:Histidine phosphatase family protein n=1 Tax=Rhizobium calliandrae TaxID=1312182 RepID=A0ABT7KLM0_9HYPH|nr:histidine phosphatase family protein [Rhizobium calliandrae]MDL2409462.1 histidine phosphatase family protein [Rhizobium calliandrae]